MVITDLANFPLGVKDIGLVEFSVLVINLVAYRKNENDQQSSFVAQQCVHFSKKAASVVPAIIPPSQIKVSSSLERKHRLANYLFPEGLTYADKLVRQMASGEKDSGE